MSVTRICPACRGNGSFRLIGERDVYIGGCGICQSTGTVTQEIYLEYFENNHMKPPELAGKWLARDVDSKWQLILEAATYALIESGETQIAAMLTHFAKSAADQAVKS